MLKPVRQFVYSMVLVSVIELQTTLAGTGHVSCEPYRSPANMSTKNLAKHSLAE